MNDKQFTDELFKRMYDLGYRKAEIESGVLFFFNGKRELLNYFLPRVMVASTCFEKKNQLIDIAEYLGIVDWSKVKVNAPILVRDSTWDAWKIGHFARYRKGHIFVWEKGKTSYTTKRTEMFRYAKLVGDINE